MQKIDLTGKRFGKLIVLRKDKKDNNYRQYFLCICDCEKKKLIRGDSLKSGAIKSCGCLLKETAFRLGKKRIIHGMTKTRIHNIWVGMKMRCNNPKHKDYKWYGAKGIIYDSRWEKFENFYEDMKFGYQDDLTLDRIDNNKDYSKENCHWATQKEQSRNKRQNRYITFRNKTQTLIQWSEELKINYGVLHSRITTYHWSIEKAFTTPILQ